MPSPLVGALRGLFWRPNLDAIALPCILDPLAHMCDNCYHNLQVRTEDRGLSLVNPLQAGSVSDREFFQVGPFCEYRGTIDRWLTSFLWIAYQ